MYRILLCLLFLLRTSEAQCPDGQFLNRLITETECESLQGKTIGDITLPTGLTPENLTTYPRGCYLWVGINLMYFNRRSDEDTSQSFGKRICIVNGMYTVMDSEERCPDSTASGVFQGECATIKCVAGYFFNTTQSVCTECPAGTYQSNDDSDATACTQWSNLSTCPAGKYYASATAISDAMCAPCPAGTYQPDDNSNATACTPWSVISIEDVGKVLSISGNATSDHQLIKLENVSSDHLTEVSPHKLKSAFQSSNGCA